MTTTGHRDMGISNRSNKRTVVYAAVLLLSVGLTTGAGMYYMQQSRADASFGVNKGRPFAADSAYNVPIGPNVELDPKSAAMVASIASQNKATALLYDFGTPIYHSSAADPTYRVQCTMNWGTCDLEERDLHISASTQPNAGSDGAMNVIDFARREVCDFWQARKTASGGWETSWGTCASIDGGVSGPRGGGTGGGINGLAGVVRIHEIEQGYIDHAISIATNNSCGPRNSTNFRFPATKTDGDSTRSDCVPEGARLQLDPSINCDTLPQISRAEVIVCKALQKYGLYNRDNAGSPIAIPFEKPVNGRPNPYPAAGLPWDYYDMPHIPWSKLRVLKTWNSHSGTPTVAPPATGDTTAPSAATNLRQTSITSSAVGMAWNASTDNVGVTKYEVWRTTDATLTSGWTMAGSVPGTILAFSDSGLVADTAYYYGVRAFDAAGNRSESSNFLTVRTGSATPALPDVVVTSLTMSPAAPKTGDRVVFTAVIKNQGTVATPTGIDIGVGFFVGITQTNWSTRGPLAAGESATITATNDLAGSAVNYWTATAGTHAITAHVDDVNRFSESNETNNKLTVNLTVVNLATTIPGDTNGDGRVNAVDLSILLSRDGQNYPAADFNNDGIVGAADMSILLSKWTW